MKISKCCNASVKVEGDVTHYYVCEMCEKACDVHELKESNMSYDIDKIIEDCRMQTIKCTEVVGAFSDPAFLIRESWLRSKLTEAYEEGFNRGVEFSANERCQVMKKINKKPSERIMELEEKYGERQGTVKGQFDIKPTWWRAYLDYLDEEWEKK